MSIMFQPPSLEEGRFGWGHLLVIGDVGDPFWSRLRRGQIAYMARYLPLVSIVMAVNSIVVVNIFPQSATGWVLACWLLVQTTIALIWVGRASILALLGATSRTDPAFMRRLLGEMAIASAGWGFLLADMLRNGPAEDASFVAALGMATLCAMFRTTAVFPLGTLSLTVPIVVGLCIGFAYLGGKDAVVSAAIMTGFLVLAVRGNLLTALEYMTRLRTGLRLAEQEEVVRLLLNEYDSNGSEWLFEFDADGRVTFVSSRFADATGQPVALVIGTHWMDALTDREAARPLIEIVERGLPYRDFILSIQIRGEQRLWSLSGTPKLGREGQLLGYRGVGSDVTERERASRQIAELASFDALTGLANRRIVHQALADGLQAGDVGLLFVDLDRFKAVNDSLGHATGDRLLKEVAIRLQDVVAEAAGPRALAGRLGGDEFAVVLRQTTPEEATRIGEALISRLSLPYVLGEKHATIGASVGLSVGPADGDTVEALMRAADLALYDVKGKGRGKVRHYDRAMHKRVEDRRALEFDLKSALDQNQLRLVFQPVVNALDERIAAFEALLRWRHPDKGDISPAVFIPIAEEAGLIGRIGDWVLNEACRVASGWPRHVKVAVNLSPLQFDDLRLVETVRQTLARWNLPPERLELELTESLFLDERQQTSRMLSDLQAMGVTFALDDFGTGYSSLGYLQKISFSRIKIDRSFVQASAADGGESTAIIQAIVALAERLGMETTAEGTETRAEFEAMRRLGCGQMQGWYFGRPMEPEDVRRLLDRSRPLVELVEETGTERRPEPSPDPWSKPSRAGRPMLPAASGRSRAAAGHSSPHDQPKPRAPLRG